MNSWLSFLRDTYSSERQIHKKCSNSGSIKRLAKIYKCKKNLGNKRKTEKFSMKNPMHNKTKKRK